MAEAFMIEYAGDGDARGFVLREAPEPSGNVLLFYEAACANVPAERIHVARWKGALPAICDFQATFFLGTFS